MSSDKPFAASPPHSVDELMQRAEALVGLRLDEIAAHHRLRLPSHMKGHKGVIGELLETALGAQAGSLPVPDFEALGIELKTLPVDERQRPRESTFVCSVNLSELLGQRWETSTVWRKLCRVLWVPIHTPNGLPPGERIVGRMLLWRPSAAQAAALRADWEEHMELLSTGQLDTITARMGQFLQIRPKAARGDSLTRGTDSEGQPGQVQPRGFYLRPAFTQSILDELQTHG